MHTTTHFAPSTQDVVGTVERTVMVVRTPTWTAFRTGALSQSIIVDIGHLTV